MRQQFFQDRRKSERQPVKPSKTEQTKQSVAKQEPKPSSKRAFHAAKRKKKPRSEKRCVRLTCKEVLDEFGIVVAHGTVQDCVLKGKTGQAPSMKGPTPASLPEEMFHILSAAFKTCIQCDQINGASEKLHNDKSISTIQRALDPIQKTGTGIVHCLLEKSEIAFKAEVEL